MTVMEAIGRCDALFYNNFDLPQKLAWLSELDYTVKRNIFDTHAGAAVPFSGYSQQTPPDTPLLVPEGFDGMYIPWLQAQMELALKETEHYNASILTFNALYREFENHYNRTHKPLGRGRFRF